MPTPIKLKRATRKRLIALLCLSASTSYSLRAATITISDGVTLPNSTPFSNSLDDYQLDSGSGAGAGTILNTSTWTQAGTSSRFFNNTYSQGLFDNYGVFNQSTSNGTSTTISAIFNNRDGAVINSTSGVVYLNGGGSHEVGSILNASSAPIYFNGGAHTLAGGTITGANYVYATAGSLTLSGDVGVTSGAATGGFGLAGSLLNGSGVVSADHGYFSLGTLDAAAVIRLTGASTKQTINTLNFANGGTLRNEGTFTHQQGSFNLDSGSGAGAGLIENYGTWNTTLSSNTSYQNTYASGVFTNYGIVNIDNASGSIGTLIDAAFINSATGVVNATAGYLYLQGGGSHAVGSVLNADTAAIYFNGGTHTLNGGTITGASHVYVSAGAVNLAGNVGATSGAATGGFGLVGTSALLSGTGMVSADHGYFSAGTLNSGAVIRLTGDSSKQTINTLNFSNGGTLRNEGTFTHQQGNFNLDTGSGAGAGLIENYGTWNTTLSTNTSYQNTYASGVFTNYGIVNIENASGSIGTLIDAAFNNSATGVLNATAGYLYLQGGGSHAVGSVLNADGAAIYFNGGTHTLSGGTITGVSHVYVSAGTVNLAGDVGATSGAATGGFGLAGTSALLSGTGMVSADHGYFSAGTLNSGAVIRLTGASTKQTGNTLNFANGGTLRNEGTFTHVQGNFNLDNGSSAGAGLIENYGTWNTTLSTNTSYQNTYASGVFTNYGIVNIDNASGSIGTLIDAAFNNSATGVLNATAGYLYLQGGGSHAVGSVLNADGAAIYFNGGTHTLNGGTLTGASYSYVSAGTVNLAGNVGATSGAATGGFGLVGTGALLSGSGMVSADHGYFSAGTLNAAAVIRLTGTASKETGNTLNFFNGGTLRNEGTFTHQQGNFNLDNGSGVGAGLIENYGIWSTTLSVNTSYQNTYSNGAFTNYGVVNIDNVSGSIGTLIDAAFNNSATGVVNATSGYLYLQGGGTHAIGSVLNADTAAIYFNGGTHTLNGGTLTGASYSYVSAGTVNLAGNVGATSGAATGGFGLVGTGALLSGTGMVSADHGYFSAGTLNSGAVIRLTGASTKQTGDTLNFANGGTLRNEGTFTHVQGNFNLDNGSSAGAGLIENYGIWSTTLASNTSYQNTYSSGAFTNYGVVNIDNASGSIGTLIDAAFNNSATGVLNATSGYLYLQGGGTHTIGSVLNADTAAIYFNGGTHTLNGGTLTGASYSYVSAGTVNLAGNVGATSGAATGGFGLTGTGALVSGTGMVSADHGYFSAGTLNSGAVIRLTGASSKQTGNTLNFANGGTLRNEGTFTHSSGDINLDTGSSTGAGRIQNLGTWELASATSLNYSNTYTEGSFTNSGLLRKSAAGTTTFAVALQNSGQLVVDEGSLILNNGSTHTGSARANSSLRFGTGSHTFTGTSASLGGDNGTLLGTVTLSEGASFVGGGANGPLYVSGSVNFAGGTLNPVFAVELSGVDAGMFSQTLITTGGIMNFGTGVTNLNIDLQYAPTMGQVFRVVETQGTGTFTGTFLNATMDGEVVSALFGSTVYSFQVTYGAGGKFVDLVNLTAAPVPEPAQAAGVLGLIALCFGGLRRRRR